MRGSKTKVAGHCARRETWFLSPKLSPTPRQGWLPDQALLLRSPLAPRAGRPGPLNRGARGRRRSHNLSQEPPAERGTSCAGDAEDVNRAYPWHTQVEATWKSRAWFAYTASIEIESRPNAHGPPCPSRAGRASRRSSDNQEQVVAAGIGVTERRCSDPK